MQGITVKFVCSLCLLACAFGVTVLGDGGSLTLANNGQSIPSPTGNIGNGSGVSPLSQISNLLGFGSLGGAGLLGWILQAKFSELRTQNTDINRQLRKHNRMIKRLMRQFDIEDDEDEDDYS